MGYSYPEWGTQRPNSAQAVAVTTPCIPAARRGARSSRSLVDGWETGDGHTRNRSETIAKNLAGCASDWVHPPLDCAGPWDPVFDIVPSTPPSSLPDGLNRTEEGMERLAAEIGRALRWARQGRGLTLRQVAQRSRDRFKPTSVAGYERGERSVSVERFSELSAIYGIPPDRLLAEALRRWGGRPEFAIDPTRVEALRRPEARLIADFVSEILELRGEPRPESITLRAGDLEILATASGRQPQEFLEEIHDALLQASGPQMPFR